MGERGGLDGGGQKGKNWDNCNRINNKKLKPSYSNVAGMSMKLYTSALKLTIYINSE